MAQIEGIRAMKGVSRKSGKEYNGVILYLSHPEDGVVGVSCEDVYIQRDLFDRVTQGQELAALVGADCKVYFDRRGFVQELEVDF